MTRGIVLCLFLSLALLCMAPWAWSAPTMAFGYLENRSGDHEYDFLETVFPNIFANAIQNIFDVTALKPAEINSRLKKYGLALAKTYQPHELIDLTDCISADYFISGNFITLPGNRITMRLTLYGRGLNRIFTFTNTGAMETEIFRLVDRITAILVDFLGRDNYFKSRPIPQGSRVGVLTNLDGARLNQLYAALHQAGFRIAGIQGNELYNPIGDGIDQFKWIVTEENSFQMVSDPRVMRFLFGGWSDDRYAREVQYRRETHRIYNLGYDKTKRRALERLKALYGLDALLIVGFNTLRTKAWVRCIDVNTRECVWMQSNLSGGIEGVCSRLTEGMLPELKKKEMLTKERQP